MITVTTRTEIAVRVTNEPGALSRVMNVVASASLPVLATCSYWDRYGAVQLVVTDEVTAMTRAFSDAGYRCSANTVVLVGPLNSPAYASVYGVELASSQISVLYSYSYESETGDYYIVFKTGDDNRAIRVLQIKSPIQAQVARAGIVERCGVAA